jgi:hypothetical protein
LCLGFAFPGERIFSLGVAKILSSVPYQSIGWVQVFFNLREEAIIFKHKLQYVVQEFTIYPFLLKQLIEQGSNAFGFANDASRKGGNLAATNVHKSKTKDG